MAFTTTTSAVRNRALAVAVASATSAIMASTSSSASSSNAPPSSGGGSMTLGVEASSSSMSTKSVMATFGLGGGHGTGTGTGSRRRLVVVMSVHLAESFVKCNPMGASRLPYKLFRELLPPPSVAPPAAPTSLPPLPPQSLPQQQQQQADQQRYSTTTTTTTSSAGTGTSTYQSPPSQSQSQSQPQQTQSQSQSQTQAAAMTGSQSQSATGEANSHHGQQQAATATSSSSSSSSAASSQQGGGSSAQPPPPSLSSAKMTTPMGTPPASLGGSAEPPVTPVVLTGGVPEANNGHDNKECDLILHTMDVIGSSVETGEAARCCLKKNSSYTITAMLGKGTFGQVIKCRVNSPTPQSSSQYLAIKVLKNKPAYFRQGMLEVGILALLNFQYDHEGSHRTVRMTDYFLVHNHLCIVFELLSMNLFELVKQNNYKGLSPRLIRVFVEQILESLEVMERAHIIHCDLKPENVLMEKEGSSRVKLIDFGSACFGNSPLYTYIQSRHYRAPEVLLGLPYTTAIDMWSLGCITAELLIGIPLFPGANEHNQIYKITDMLGPFPSDMLEKGTHSSKFFKRVYSSEQHSVKFVLKSIAEYQLESKVKVEPDKRYFAFRTLPELIQKTPIRPHGSVQPLSEEQIRETRRSMEHFLKGLLQFDPTRRWTPTQAKSHPFITDTKLTDDWVPPPAPPKPKLLDNFYTSVVSMMKNAPSQGFVSSTYFLQFMQLLTRHLSLLNAQTTHVTPALYQPSVTAPPRTDLSPVSMRRRSASESVRPNQTVVTHPPTPSHPLLPPQSQPQTQTVPQTPPQPQVQPQTTSQTQTQAPTQPLTAPSSPQHTRLPTTHLHASPNPATSVTSGTSTSAQPPPPIQLLPNQKTAENRRASWAPLPNSNLQQQPSSPLSNSLNSRSRSGANYRMVKGNPPASPGNTAYVSSHSPNNTPAKRPEDQDPVSFLGSTPTTPKGMAIQYPPNTYFPPNNSWVPEPTLHNPGLTGQSAYHAESLDSIPTGGASSGLSLQLKAQPEHHSRSHHGSQAHPTSLSPTSPPLLPGGSTVHSNSNSTSQDNISILPSLSTAASTATHLHSLPPPSPSGGIPIGGGSSASGTSPNTNFPVLGTSMTSDRALYLPPPTHGPTQSQSQPQPQSQPQQSQPQVAPSTQTSPPSSPSASPHSSHSPSHHHRHHRSRSPTERHSPASSPHHGLNNSSSTTTSSASSSASLSSSPGGTTASTTTTVPATTGTTDTATATTTSGTSQPAQSHSKIHEFLKKFKF
ncbi:Dual specificity protein kinase YAK1 [Pelomyxa schiedti]|nr:Dual specificity protein kinase YAK1 [Pelomyxa schiedti]